MKGRQHEPQACAPLAKGQRLNTAALDTRYLSICGFGALWLVSCIIAWPRLQELAGLAWSDSRYTHLAIVPFISAGLILYDRHFLTGRPNFKSRLGLLAVLSGVVIQAPLGPWLDSPYLHLAAGAIGIILTWVGAFVLAFGTTVAGRSVFSLSLLLLAVPPPAALIGAVETLLQHGSAELSAQIFSMIGIPVFRQDLLFSLPGFTIEIARECSGIRSSVSLMITALVLGRLGLRSNWTKATLVLAALPIALLKNAIRIVTISWLGLYVSQDYLRGSLHTSGGPVFSVPALALLLLILWILSRSERAVADSPREPNSGAAYPASVDVASPTGG